MFVLKRPSQAYNATVLQVEHDLLLLEDGVDFVQSRQPILAETFHRVQIRALHMPNELDL